MREKEKEREQKYNKKKQKNNSTTEYIFEISTTTKRELYIPLQNYYHVYFI